MLCDDLGSFIVEDHLTSRHFADGAGRGAPRLSCAGHGVPFDMIAPQRAAVHHEPIGVQGEAGDKDVHAKVDPREADIVGAIAKAQHLHHVVDMGASGPKPIQREEPRPYRYAHAPWVFAIGFFEGPARAVLSAVQQKTVSVATVR